MVAFLWKWHVTTGYREYMRQPEVRRMLREAAERIADAAGGPEAGFEVDLEAQSGRRKVPRTSVRTATYEAKRLEATERRLTKALDAGRDV